MVLDSLGGLRPGTFTLLTSYRRRRAPVAVSKGSTGKGLIG